uniref:response regulator transcription factor n=1 Tax=Candidatus Enterococcus willemsii TaxID=1857215 RepID=UPI00403FBBC8
MYHVLLADDHFDQRELFRFLLEKRQEQWTIYEATNGKEALEFVETHPIDLLITDVQMPFISGIELAETIRRKNTTLPILFISGYDDFQYAKKALDLQAVNYLLKPINPQEFHTQVDELIHRVQEIKNNIRQQKRRRYQPILLKLLNGVSFDQLTPEDQKTIEELMAANTYLMTIDTSNYDTDELKDYLEIYEPPLIFVQTNVTRFVCLLSNVSKQQAQLFQRTFTQQLQATQIIDCTVRLSKSCPHPTALFRTYQQLHAHITHGFYQKTANEHLAQELPTNDSTQETKVMTELHDLLQQQNMEAITQLLATLFTQYEESATESPSIVKFFFARLYRILIDFLESNNIEVQNGFQSILEATAFIQLPPIFDDILTVVHHRFLNLNQTTNDYVRETKNYIWNHYSEELNLEVLATNVHLSPKYLSNLFKQEEAIGLIKYLNKVRIEKAQELLLTSHYRVREISQLVGFNSYSYFIKSFQKYTSVTPERYRKAKGMITHET